MSVFFNVVFGWFFWCFSGDIGIHTFGIHTEYIGNTLIILLETFGNIFGIPWEYFGCTLGNLWEYFGNTLGILWE